MFFETIPGGGAQREPWGGGQKSSEPGRSQGASGTCLWKSWELALLRLEQGHTRSEYAWDFEVAVNGIFHQPWSWIRGFSGNGVPQCSMRWASWGIKYRRQQRPRGVYLKVREENVLLEHRTWQGPSLTHRVLSERRGTPRFPCHLRSKTYVGCKISPVLISLYFLESTFSFPLSFPAKFLLRNFGWTEGWGNVFFSRPLLLGKQSNPRGQVWDWGDKRAENPEKVVVGQGWWKSKTWKEGSSSWRWATTTGPLQRSGQRWNWSRRV